jgi:cytochrome c oxidase subunit 2
MLDPAGPAATAIAGTWWLMFAGAAAVFTLVMALLAWAMLRPRGAGPLRRPERLVVLGGLVLPTVVLAALLVYGTLAGARVVAFGQPSDRVIEVEGRQWQWRFRYLDDAGDVVATSIDRLALPVDELVEFRITSADVIHSFWIPRLGGKIDAIPGRVNVLRLKADRTGTMRGQCAEFCGREHAHMVFAVEVLDAGGFAGWLAQAGGGAVLPESGR